MSSDDRQQLFEALGAEVRAYQNALDKADDAVAEVLGINRTDARCLDIVDQHGRITPGQLGVEAGLTTGAVTAVVDRLERSGLIRRLRDDEDRRRVWLEVTPSAAETIHTMFEPMLQESSRHLERFSTKDLATMTEFIRMAREVTDAFNERLRGKKDTKINAAVTKLRNKAAAKQRKLASMPNRLGAKLDAKQDKLEAKIANVKRGT